MYTRTNVLNILAILWANNMYTLNWIFAVNLDEKIKRYDKIIKKSKYEKHNVGTNSFKK